MTTIVKVSAWLSILVAVLWTAIGAESTTDPVLASSEGGVVVNIDNVPVDAASKVNQGLPAGALIVTSNDGRAILRLGDDLFVELQPSTELTIGEIVEAGSTGTDGSPLPQIKLTLNSGSLVLLSSPESLAATSVAIVTPRGTVSPVNAGDTLVVLEGADPTTSSITVVSLSGNGLVTTADGTTAGFGNDVAVVVTADGNVQTSNLSELSGGSSYESLITLASTSVSALQTSTLQTQAVMPQSTAQSTSTSSRPAPSPSPTTLARPQPSPSPSPSRPQPSPSPSPSRPQPSPSPSPTPTPSPTQTPADSP